MGANQGEEPRWRGLCFSPVMLDAPELERLRSAFRALYANGGVIFVCAEAEDVAHFDRVFAEDWRREPELFRWLLSLLFVADANPALRVRPQAKLAFDWDHSLALDGDLAAMLAKSGAYGGFRRPFREAKALGQGFCGALYGERYEEVEVYSTWEAWADWFGDVAWDRTWIVIDKGLRRVAVLCVTDSD